MKSLLIFSFFCFFATFIHPVAVAADTNFHMAVIADYIFNDQGQSRVHQQVSLTNETSHLYANSYQLTIAGGDPQNLIGFDASGPLNITASPQRDTDTTKLNLIFNVPAVGKGSTQRFTLEYDSKPAIKNGQVWEIILPKLSQSQIIDTYILNLHVPESFGSPAFITPSPSTSQENIYSFTKDQLTKSGVVAAFGDLQTFSFNLSYSLSNPSNSKKIHTITLPPDTSYQKIYYEEISPRPDTVTVDLDGNWLAEYTLSPKQNLKISAVGQVRLYANPGPAPVPPPSSTLEEYIKVQKYWETTDPVLIQLAANLTTPEKIFWYVVGELKFNRSLLASSKRPSRLGAVESLKSPDGSLCTEFTDLFITLARINGIPARRLVGYAYTTDPSLQPLTLAGNLLHTWPEYWDNETQTWISVDPTWSNTTDGVDFFNSFDINHFVFSINGSDSELPLPVGQFTTDDGIISEYKIKFDQYRDHPPEFPEVNLKKPFAFLPFIKNRVDLEIHNNQGRAVYKLPLTITSSGMELDSDPSLNQTVLPPFSKLIVPITFKGSFFPKFSSMFLHVKLSDRTMTYNIPQNIFFVWYGIFIFIISTLLIGLATVTVHAWSLHLQGRDRGDYIRRQGQKSQKSG